MNLRDIRERIDALDREILDLLDRRMELALRAGPLKRAIRDERREARVLDSVGLQAAAHHRLLREEFIRALYGEILKESRRVQERQKTGEAGE